MPGTQPYLYAKKGVALNMYEQLGPPNFFMTLSCHARQPALLLAAISARLLRLHPDRPQANWSSTLQRSYSATRMTRTSLGMGCRPTSCATSSRQW